VLLAAAAFICPGLAGAQPSDLGDVYGSINLQYVTAGFTPIILPFEGGAGEMAFGFNTLSAKTEDTAYKYFYGASLGGGGFGLRDADLGGFGERDASAGYIFLQLENKLFLGDPDDPVLPYLGGKIGYGSGGFWAEDTDDEDNPSGGLDMYYVGIETGVHVPVSQGYALTLSVGMDARGLVYGGGFSGAYPAMASIGVCYWGGPLD